MADPTTPKESTAPKKTIFVMHTTKIAEGGRSTWYANTLVDVDETVAKKLIDSGAAREATSDDKKKNAAAHLNPPNAPTIKEDAEKNNPQTI